MTRRIFSLRLRALLSDRVPQAGRTRGAGDGAAERAELGGALQHAGGDLTIRRAGFIHVRKIDGKHGACKEWHIQSLSYPPE